MANHELANALVDVKFTLDLPESVVESIVDESESRTQALITIENAVREEPFRWADYMTAGEPDVEADG